MVVGLTSNELVGLLVATSFAAGLNVYATVGTLGLLAHAGVLALPVPLHLLGNWWVIGASAILFLVEFFADKVPFFDLLWNALQTFVRVPVAALIAYGATSQLSPAKQLLAVLIGGAIALAAHGGKTAMRAAVTAFAGTVFERSLKSQRRCTSGAPYYVRNQASIFSGSDRRRFRGSYHFRDETSGARPSKAIS